MDQPHTRRGLRVLVSCICLAFLATAAASSTVVVRSGDSLWLLAHRHHTTVASLRELNHLQGTNTIYIGETLKVPAAPARPKPAARPTSTIVRRIHVVVRGDSLIAIAKQYRTTAKAIRAQNPSIHRGVVRLGQRLGVLVRVAVKRPAQRAARTAATNAGARISARVQHSAAAHRATLAHRHLPSKAAVRRMIQKTARKQGVDPALALAVAYNESGFQQRVVSPVDAIGVMQVLPSTGRVLNRAARRHLNLLKTEDNVLAGVLLLKSLYRATGSTGMTLAGYYQGLGSVGRRGLLPQTHAYIRTVSVLRHHFQHG